MQDTFPYFRSLLVRATHAHRLVIKLPPHGNDREFGDSDVVAIVKVEDDVARVDSVVHSTVYGPSSSNSPASYHRIALQALRVSLSRSLRRALPLTRCNISFH
jgi:hypothetical protein